jgi:hypothetical protein
MYSYHGKKKTLILTLCLTSVASNVFGTATKSKNYLRATLSIYLCVKAKAISVQAWTGPEDSRRLRLPDFQTIGI